MFSDSSTTVMSLCMCSPWLLQQGSLLFLCADVMLCSDPSPAWLGSVTEHIGACTYMITGLDRLKNAARVSELLEEQGENCCLQSSHQLLVATTLLFTVLAVFHRTRRMPPAPFVQLPLLKCCGAGSVFSIFSGSWDKKDLRICITWVFLFLRSSPKSMQTCVTFVIPCTHLFVPKCAIKTFLRIHNPSESFHSSFLPAIVQIALDVLIMLCYSYTQKHHMQDI